MGYIYIIKNTVNDKVYIGQTTQTLRERFKQHLILAKSRVRETKFCKAIMGLGEDKFYIVELEECPNDLLNSREIFYISKYDSFNNGYNSTFGGGHGYSKLAEINTDKFIYDYMHDKPLLIMAVEHGITIQSAMKLRDRLGLEKREIKLVNSSGCKPAIVDKLDKYFNYICTYESIASAIRDLDKTGYGYCYIRESTLGGNIAFGYRWQDREYTTNTDGIVYNTIYDKYEHEVLEKPIIMDHAGRWRAQDIDYSKYVGISASMKCEICGNYMKNGVCKVCEKRMEKHKESTERSEYIRQLMNTGISLSEAGRILGMSGNAVKKYCKRHGIEYSTKHTDELIIVTDRDGNRFTSTVNELADYLINIGVADSSKYGSRTKIKKAMTYGKDYLGYKIQEFDPDIGCETFGEYTARYNPKIDKKVKVVYNRLMVVAPNGSKFECTMAELVDYFINNGFTTMDKHGTQSRIRKDIKEGKLTFKHKIIPIN